MKIATWNINGLQARLDFVLHWLRARKPDYVCLQELKLVDEKFPKLIFEAEGYRAWVHGQKAWNGVAILSRRPGNVVTKGLPGAEEEGARLLTVSFEELELTSVYCPNGKSIKHEDYPRKLDWFARLNRYLAEKNSSENRYLIGGDFNICPAPIDSWNEEGLKDSIFHTGAERDAFKELLATGLHDVYREVHPEKQMFSWWDYRAGAFHRNHGLRIDFLLASGPLCEDLKDAEIDRQYRKKKDGLTASDHAPVMATFE